MSLTGRKPEELSLPHELQIDPHSGSAQLRVQVPLPPGRAGLAPLLSLGYSSGAGNSEIGVAWSLSGAPPIAIFTRDRLPRWDGADPVQIGGAELVPWLEEVAGEWRPRGHQTAGWSVGLMRVRRGPLRLRAERWVERATGRVHYRSRSAGDLVTIYGARPAAAARIADPGDEARTLSWLPELQIDPHGNAIWFDYAAETVDGVDRAAPYEPRRPALAQRYLKRILYGNAEPLALTDAVLAGELPAGLRWCFQVVLDYGDHSDPDRPAAAPDRPWPARADPFTSCRAGFPVRSYRLCRRILSYHHVAELGPEPSLVGALVLDQEEAPAGTALRALRHVGYRRDGEVVSQKQLPPLRFSYAPAAVDADLVPHRSLENLPAGLGRGHAFVDLLGEGLPGILTERDRAWYFKRNLGGGRFAPQITLGERPAARSRDLALADVDADGNTELSILSGRLAGSYEFDREAGAWCPWRPQADIPRAEAWGARAQWVDLDGDGKADLVVPRHDSLVWYPSSSAGFGPPVEVPRPDASDEAPVIGASTGHDLFFADMNGDGLVDLVRIQDGRVVYWPSLGNGHFGEAITMEGAPPFADHRDLDSRRIRFVDLDGSGTADLLYLGAGEVTCWINQAGNRLAAGPRLSGLPYFDGLSEVSVVDLLGERRPCLVWSTPLPGRETPLEYLPLAPPVQPGLLTAIDDSMGLVTEIGYSASASHYLRDGERGRTWSHHLPRNQLVADRRVVRDLIAGTRAETRLEYHDGFLDGGDRAIAGFAQVDVFDASEVEDPAEPGGAASAPPSLTRAWYHLGASMANHRRPAEVYLGDPDLPELPPHVVAAPPAVTDETEDGLRALAGMPIRREVWATDAAGRPAGHPFHVEQTSYLLTRTQPRHGGRRPGWTVATAENLVAHYEREAGDPRLQHQISVDIDAYGLVARAATIAYRRRPGRPREVAAQGRDLVTVADQRLLHIDEADRFELAIQLEGRRYELGGVPAPGAAGRVLPDDLRSPAVVAALSAPNRFHVDLPADAVAPTARLLSWSQSLYWDHARSGALPLGQVGGVTLVHHEESACFTPELISGTFGDRVDAARLAALGFAERDGHWWASDPVRDYAPPDRFSLRVGVTRADGTVVRSELDPYHLVPVATVDPLGGRLEVAIDYNLVAPFRATDPNGMVVEVRFDPLGVVTAGTQHGAIDGAPWGFDRLADIEARAPANLAELIADPAHFLQGATAFTWYDLDAWWRDRQPPVLATVAAESLRRDPGLDLPAGNLHQQVTYLDGARRPLQSKVAVDPGPAIQRGPDGDVVVDAGGRPVLADAAVRWRAAGGVAYDQKGQPGRLFEPYHAPDHRYDPEPVLQRLGVSTLILYDALGREVARHQPDGSAATTAHHAWSIDSADRNDTVADSVYRALREGLPAGAAERAALEHALAHAGTATTSFLDPLGRTVGALHRGGATADDRRVETRLDASGQARSIVDPRGLVAATARHDMCGQIFHGSSVDAGDSWQLPDALGRPALAWSGRGFAFERSFDPLDRPTALVVRGGDGAPMDHQVMTWTYGESLPADEARRRNALGRVVTLRDAAGETEVVTYDPSGLATSVVQRLRADPSAPPDWRSAVALGETFTATAARDAFARPWREVLADGTVKLTDYAAGGAIARSRLLLPDGSEVPVFDGASHGARGELIGMRLGNGVEVEQTWDPMTGRLARQVARRGTRRYQEIEYTYDPVGNLVRLVDLAHQGPGAVIAGVAVPARRDFTYDAHYRLRRDTGRVHQALVESDIVPGTGGTLKGTRHLGLDNGAAVEAYTRTYDYDPGGNLRSIHHAAASRSWTTTMWISPTSNRSVPALDAGGTPVVAPETWFDAGGNLRQLSHLRGLEWGWQGALERAVVIERPGGVDDDERYVHGADGMRVVKRATRLVQGGQVEVIEKLYLGGCERKRILRDGQVLLERWSVRVGDAAGATVHRWTVDALARETDDLAAPKIHYRLATHQGSAALELDPAGEIISYEEYFAHGGTAFLAGDDARGIERKDYRYCGKECDDVTGLYYVGLRYYAPWIGRWLSPDPAGPADDLNLYQYVLGDPVGNVDPDGTQSLGTLGKVSSRDKHVAIAQFNARDGVLHNIQVLDAEFRDGNWYITDSRPLGLTRQQRLDAITSEMTGWLPTVQPPRTGDGWGEGRETDAGEHTAKNGGGDGGAATVPEGEQAGDPNKDPKAAVGFDEMDVAGRERGPDAMGYQGLGPGGGKEGDGPDAEGARGNESEGGVSKVSGSGEGPGIGKATGGGAGSGDKGDGIGPRGGKGSNLDPGAAPAGARGGGGPGTGKKGDPKKDPPTGKGGGTSDKAKTGGNIGSPQNPLADGDAIGARGLLTGDGGEGRGGGSKYGDPMGEAELPHDGSSRFGTIGGDPRATRAGDPRGHAGGSDSGKVGGSKDGDPDGRQGGSPNGWPGMDPGGKDEGSIFGVHGCGGDYVPPEWLSPWLNAVTVLPAAVGAATEIAGGVALLLAPEPVATKAAGVGLIAHGLDSMWATMTGQRTYTAQGIESAAAAAGADPEDARIIGDLGDMAVPVALGGVAALGRRGGPVAPGSPAGETVVGSQSPRLPPSAVLPPAPAVQQELRSVGAMARQSPAGQWEKVTRPDIPALDLQGQWSGRPVSYGKGTIILEEYRVDDLLFDGATFERNGGLLTLDEFKASYQGSIIRGDVNVANSLRRQAGRQLRIALRHGIELRWHVPAGELNAFRTVLGHRGRFITFVTY